MLSPGCYLSITSITSFLMTTSHSITSSSNHSPSHITHDFIHNMTSLHNSTPLTSPPICVLRSSPNYTSISSPSTAAHHVSNKPHRTLALVFSHLSLPSLSTHVITQSNITHTPPICILCSPQSHPSEHHFTRYHFSLQPMPITHPTAATTPHALLFPHLLLPLDLLRHYYQLTCYFNSHIENAMTLIASTCSATPVRLLFTTTHAGCYSLLCCTF